MAIIPVILEDDIRDRISEIKEADILVGIPSFNNSRTISHVVRAVEAGLGKYFSNYRSILVNSDGGSADNTMDIVKETTLDHSSVLIQHNPDGGYHKFATPYQGIPGKGSAFRTIFEVARLLNVKACAVVDSDLRSITPEWIELLIKPVLNQGYDYVAPYYLRHKFDGTITNSIVYPITRALYGRQIRQPIGGEFGFSGKLASFYLEKDVWESDVARFGIDIWMTTTAVANGFKVCQAFLGAKIHDAKDPGADLSAMLYQVISTVFNLMGEYVNVWGKTTGSEPVHTLGFVYSVGLEPINVNLDGMLDKFKLGVKDLWELYENFLSEEHLTALKKLSDKSKDDFSIPDDLWVEIVYSFAVAFHKKVMNQEHLIRSLTPLYLGKVTSFVIENWESSAEEVEGRLEHLCRAYENNKEYLIQKWHGKG